MSDRWRLLRFASVGGLSTCIHIAVVYGSIWQWSASPPLANGLAFLVATLFSYGVNASWTFSARPSASGLRRFVVVALCGLLLSLGLSHVAMVSGLPTWGGIALVVMLVPLFTYVMHAKWTFSSR